MIPLISANHSDVSTLFREQRPHSLRIHSEPSPEG